MGLLLLFFLAIVLLWLFGTAGLVYSISHPRRKTFAIALANDEPTDPADMQLEAQAVTFTFTDKLRTPGWIIQGRKANGPTVVMLHGFGDSRYGLLKRSLMWLDYARKVVVFDLPGQGESEAKHGYGGLREPEDVLGILEQLAPDDAKRVVLVGISMGGGIAIAAAAKARGELKHNIIGVIAEGPYRHWDDPLHNLFRWHRYPRFPIIPLAGLWLSLTARGFNEFDRVGYAARLGCPLLVLHGSEDGLCPPLSAQQIAKAAPDGRYVEIEGGSHHGLPFDHEQAYRSAVEDFMQMLCETAGSGKMENLAGPG